MTFVVWECEADGGWVKYERPVRDKLEAAYEKKLPVNWFHRGTDYTVDWDFMVQKNDTTGRSRPIRRKVVECESDVEMGTINPVAGGDGATKIKKGGRDGAATKIKKGGRDGAATKITKGWRNEPPPSPPSQRAPPPRKLPSWVHAGNTSRDKIPSNNSPSRFKTTSHFFVRKADAWKGTPNANDRNNFIRKVYSLLTFQLLVTVGVSALCMFPWRDWCLSNLEMYWFFVISSFITLFSLFVVKDSYPLNYIVLFAFTLCEAWTIGVLCAIYEENGTGGIILKAFILTAAVFLGCTAFACNTSIDFTQGAGCALTLLLAIIAWIVLGNLWGFHRMDWISLVGALVFCFFIVIDTQMIIEKYGYDDHIIATIELYLDIINLFIYIAYYVLYILSHFGDGDGVSYSGDGGVSFGGFGDGAPSTGETDEDESEQEEEV